MFDLIWQKQPSQSARDFCAANGIGEASYYYWLKKYKLSAGPSKESFVPVHISAATSLAVASIQMPGGAIISVYDVQVLSFMQPYL